MRNENNKENKENELIVEKFKEEVENNNIKVLVVDINEYNIISFLRVNIEYNKDNRINNIKIKILLDLLDKYFEIYNNEIVIDYNEKIDIIFKLSIDSFY